MELFIATPGSKYLNLAISELTRLPSTVFTVLALPTDHLDDDRVGAGCLEGSDSDFQVFGLGGGHLVRVVLVHSVKRVLRIGAVHLQQLLLDSTESRDAGAGVLVRDDRLDQPRGILVLGSRSENVDARKAERDGVDRDGKRSCKSH